MTATARTVRPTDAFRGPPPSRARPRRRPGRFPGVLYLAPESDDRFRALTLAVADRWPEVPPYGGRFAEVVPHLMVAHGQEPSVLDAVEADLAGRLPVTTRVGSVQLLVFDGIVA